MTLFVNKHVWLSGHGHKKDIKGLHRPLDKIIWALATAFRALFNDLRRNAISGQWQVGGSLVVHGFIDFASVWFMILFWSVALSRCGASTELDLRNARLRKHLRPAVTWYRPVPHPGPRWGFQVFAKPTCARTLPKTWYLHSHAPTLRLAWEQQWSEIARL